jgi:hypothetical protein
MDDPAMIHGKMRISAGCSLFCLQMDRGFLQIPRDKAPFIEKAGPIRSRPRAGKTLEFFNRFLILA